MPTLNFVPLPALCSLLGTGTPQTHREERSRKLTDPDVLLSEADQTPSAGRRHFLRGPTCTALPSWQSPGAPSLHLSSGEPSLLCPTSTTGPFRGTHDVIS